MSIQEVLIKADEEKINTLCDNVKKEIHRVFEQNIKLVEENQALHDEHYKDKKLQEMQEKLNTMQDDLIRGFSISSDELDAVKEWFDKHKGQDSTTEGKFVKYPKHYIHHYIFTPTEIGTVGEVVCHCGEKFEFQSL